MNDNRILGTNLDKRIYGLDILRFFAIMPVLLLHTRSLLPNVILKYVDKILYDGVAVFFVLSGFLIGGILLKTIDNTSNFSKSNLLNFWCNRWLRTLPLYYIILLIHCSLPKEEIGSLEIFKYFLFLQNFNSKIPNFFIESWSLSVEEWFYLLIPLILFLGLKICRNKKYLILSIILFIMFFSIVIRYYKYNNLLVLGFYPLSAAQYLKLQVITRFDGIIYGVFVAYIAYYYKDVFNKNVKLMFSIGITLFALFYLCFRFFADSEISILLNCLFSSSILSIAIALMLPFLSSVKKCGNRILYNFITLVSLISYSMYLLHMVVWEFVNYIDFLSMLPNTFKLSIIWVFTILISCVTYRFIERPIMNLRKYIKFS